MDATKALIKYYKPLQIALERLSTETKEKGETRAEAMGLQKKRMNTLGQKECLVGVSRPTLTKSGRP